MSTQTGLDMHKLAQKLFPILRSITGPGVEETLRILQEEVPLEIRQVKSGTQVFDWTVPKEWHLKEAYVEDAQGNRVIDVKNHTLHALNFSAPISQKMPLSELKKHLFTLPQQPQAIPYKTSYYDENWGFCLTHSDLLKLEEGDYFAHIKSEFVDGNLTYGECFLPGTKKDEVLVSTHICHPSMANDNLSGIVVATYLAKALSKMPNRVFSYRFLFIPSTIGSITWLATHEKDLVNIKHGIVLTNVGDPGPFHYKKSRQGAAEIDFQFAESLANLALPLEIMPFSAFGYDERQYCSPGINLAVGCLMRSQHGTYPEYHTSLDNLDFIKAESLDETLTLVTDIVKRLESSVFYKNMLDKGEPQLGKRGLYQAMNNVSGDTKDLQMAMLWVLNYSDGLHSTAHIAHLAKLSIELISQAATMLEEANILKKI